MSITTLANSFIYCVSRSFIYTGPLIWISIVFGSIVDIFYGALTKPFVNSQKQVDKMIHESISSKSSQKQVAIVTGGNSGIGYATAKAIGRAGYHTILACRNQSLGEKAVANLVRETGQTNFELMILDLASFESVHKFVKQFKSKYQQLNLLVNNAGVVKANHMLTADGVEMQFGTNYLGPFLLTTELLDIMKQTGSARIVNVSSLGSYFNSHMDTKLVEDTRHYNALRVYYNSKLAITMFSAALARKLQGTGITVNSLHPGWINTNMTRSGSDRNAVQDLLFINPTQGALTTIYLALSPKANGISGKYFARCQPTHVHPSVGNIDKQETLWKYSEQLIAKHS